jgi:hypothetical protein
MAGRALAQLTREEAACQLAASIGSGTFVDAAPAE